MTTASIAKPTASNSAEKTQGFHQGFFPISRLILALGFLAVLTGCGSFDTSGAVKVRSDAMAEKQVEVLTMREGDILKIGFPGTANLDTTQQIRRDGRINLPIIGEIKVTGMSPSDLEKQLIQLYATQLVSKEVTVTMVASNFTVFVTGAVLRPGKVTSDHPLTALEALLEAGGYDEAKANLKEVSIIRNEEGRTKTYLVNLKEVLEGKGNDTFTLRPNDKMIVPTKFSWF